MQSFMRSYDVAFSSSMHDMSFRAMEGFMRSCKDYISFCVLGMSTHALQGASVLAVIAGPQHRGSQA